MSGINCMLLSRDEHIPSPPDRVTAFWLAVARYGLDMVNQWIESLPFKVRPDTPWAGTWGAEVVQRIPLKVKVANNWDMWFNSIQDKVDREG